MQRIEVRFLGRIQKSWRQYGRTIVTQSPCGSDMYTVTDQGLVYLGAMLIPHGSIVIPEKYVIATYGGRLVVTELTSGLPRIVNRKIGNLLSIGDTLGFGQKHIAKYEESSAGLNVIVWNSTADTLSRVAIYGAGGEFISSDECNVLWRPKDLDYVVLWKPGSEMIIDVCSLLLRSSDTVDTPGRTRFHAVKQNGELYYILAEGYKGAVRVNPLTGVCQSCYEWCTFTPHVLHFDTIRGPVLFNHNRYTVAETGQNVSDPLVEAFSGESITATDIPGVIFVGPDAYYIAFRTVDSPKPQSTRNRTRRERFLQVECQSQ